MEKKLFIIVLFVSLIFLSLKSFSMVNVIGSVSDYEEINLGEGKRLLKIFTEDDGICYIIPYGSSTVRVIWSLQEVKYSNNMYSDINMGKSDIWELTDDFNKINLNIGDLKIEVMKVPNIVINFKGIGGNLILEGKQMLYNLDYAPYKDDTYYQDNMELPRGYRFKVLNYMKDDDAFFGFGEFSGPLNRKGYNIQCWNRAKWGWDEYQNPMYKSFPFFYGVNEKRIPYAIFVNNTVRPVFKMGTESEEHYSFEAGDGQLDYFFFAENMGVTKIIEKFSDITGKPIKLSKWSFGYQQSRYGYGSQNTFYELLNNYKKYDIPLEAVYIDIENQDNHNQLSFNNSFFNVNEMIDKFELEGVKLIPLVEPCLTTEDKLYNSANDNELFLKNSLGETHVGNIFIGDISWLDFSNRKTREWWKQKNIEFLDRYPFAGIWNDLNEPQENNINLEIEHKNDYMLENNMSKNHLFNRNIYNIQECSLTYDILKEKYPDKRPFVLSRSGWPGIQKYAVGWSGDNRSNYEHLRHNIPLGISTMISGQANYGHDIGGFVGKSEGELLTRWHEWGAFMPLFRNHTDSAENSQEPWVFGEPYTSKIRKIINNRYKLMPYLYSLMIKASETGIPMNTPTMFYYTHDKNTYNKNDYDFMVGENLLISPVFNKNQKDKWTYLPSKEKNGIWYNWYTDAKHSEGQNAYQRSPLGQVPIYVRNGSIIPMGPSPSDKSLFKEKPEYIDIHVWPNVYGYTTFEMFEDNGENNKKNQITTFRNFSDVNNEWVFRSEIESNGYNSERKWQIVVRHDVSEPYFVSNNSVIFDKKDSLEIFHSNGEGYYYDKIKRLIYIKISAENYNKIDLEVKVNNNSNVKKLLNTHNYPKNGVINENCEVWLNSESYPKGSGVSAEAFLWINRGFTRKSMRLNGSGDNTDKWNTNLGKYKKGTIIEYLIKVNNNDYTYIESERKKIVVGVGFTEPEVENVFIRGTFNSWKSKKMNYLCNNIWISRETFGNSENERFKFDILGDWSENYGNNNDDFIADKFGEDFYVKSNNTYDIIFNYENKQYNIIDKYSLKKCYKNVFFRGTSSDWKPVSMRLIEDFTWEIEQKFGESKNERFKFDIYNDWTENYGDDNLDGFGDRDGKDIFVGANKSYNITFNGVTKQYKIKEIFQK